MNTIATKTQLPVQQIVQWCGVARGKFYDWRKRYGKVNEHNGLVPAGSLGRRMGAPVRDRLLRLPPTGTGIADSRFMMLDEDVVGS